MKKTDFSKKVAISIIIPLFNKEKFIENSLDLTSLDDVDAVYDYIVSLKE